MDVAAAAPDRERERERCELRARAFSAWFVVRSSVRTYSCRLQLCSEEEKRRARESRERRGERMGAVAAKAIRMTSEKLRGWAVGLGWAERERECDVTICPQLECLPRRRRDTVLDSSTDVACFIVHTVENE